LKNLVRQVFGNLAVEYWGVKREFFQKAAMPAKSPKNNNARREGRALSALLEPMCSVVIEVCENSLGKRSFSQFPQHVS